MVSTPSQQILQTHAIVNPWGCKTQDAMSRMCLDQQRQLTLNICPGAKNGRNKR